MTGAPEKAGATVPTSEAVLTMRYEEMTGKVQAEAQLPDRQSAERVVSATLETLAERLPDGVADHLAAQLPEGAAEAVRRITAAHQGSPELRAQSRDRGESFDMTTFAGRIAWRTGSSEEAALREAAAVFEVLDAAVSPELMHKVGSVLPRDIGELMPEWRAGEGGLPA